MLHQPASQHTFIKFIYAHIGWRFVQCIWMINFFPLLLQTAWLWVTKVTVTPQAPSVSGDLTPLTNTLQDSCTVGTLPAEWWGSNFYLHCLADSIGFPLSGVQTVGVDRSHRSRFSRLRCSRSQEKIISEFAGLIFIRKNWDRSPLRSIRLAALTFFFW